MAPFSIEPATWRDLGALRKIEKECFQEDAWPLFDLIAVLSFPKIIRLKAVDNGEMIGFIAGDPRPSEHMGWVTTLCVDSRHRRKGIATTLLETCESMMNLPRVRLSVRKSNISAQRLYEKEGYHLVTVWSKYYPGGEDALVLEKRR